MKKNILLAIVMMLMTAVNALAQKEYNMVITLNNGTTVTLGHNDIKEITFNDGAVAISGNMVNTIDSLANVTTVLGNQIYAVAGAADQKFNNVAAFVDAQNAVNNEQKNLNNAQESVNSELQEAIDLIFTVMEMLHPEIASAANVNNAKVALATAIKVAAESKGAAVKETK
ncbi:MAG: hypothetical protein J6B33_07205 [Prevotella sp.]|nr:hypothetical protein [Prevotella sp.]